MEKRRKKTSQSRGTDDPFYKLMHTGGEAILKLIGVKSPGNYAPKAIVLKERTLYPDMVAEPADGGERVFIEFQGYKAPMIRYSLTSKITAYCTRENYTGAVLGVVIYTEKIFQDNALSLDLASASGDCRIIGQFREIVLSEYSEKQLTSVDPRLIVLAPFTIPKSANPEQLTVICQKWKNIIGAVYPEDIQNESLEILGLFILSRFRNLSVKEVIAMLHLNLEDTRAGKELIRKGEKQGEKKGSLNKTRKLLMNAIREKFGDIPEGIPAAIKRISKEQFLDDLFVSVFRCRTIDEFSDAFRQVKLS